MKRKVWMALFVVLVIVFTSIYAVKQNDANSPKTLQKQNQTLKKRGSQNNHARSVAPNQDVAFWFGLRLREGVPVIRIRLGEQATTVIFDTGSTHLNVAHKSCRECSKVDGAYNGRLDPSAPTSVIRYGTQQDVVRATQDRLTLPRATPRLRRAETPAERVRVNFFATVKRSRGVSGNSNLNVFGAFTRKNQGVTSQILPRNYTLVCDLNSKDGFVAGVSHSYAAALRRARNRAFSQCRLANIHSLPYFVVRVNKMTVRSAAGSWTDSTVKYMIVDTGTNMLSLPPAVFSRTVRNTKSLRSSLEFELQGVSGPVGLNISRANLYWRNGNEPMMDNQTTHMPNLSLANQTCIIGTHQLKNKVLQFTRTNFFFSD
jgi:hypothetical protein